MPVVLGPNAASKKHLLVAAGWLKYRSTESQMSCWDQTHSPWRLQRLVKVLCMVWVWNSETSFISELALNSGLKFGLPTLEMRHAWLENLCIKSMAFDFIKLLACSFGNNHPPDSAVL